MNFHNLKRRELQALCKKHKIPANLTNLEMAENLTAFFAVNEKAITQGPRSCLKVLGENVSENESDLENRPAKKVRFSPENETIEFEKSKVRYLEIQGRGRRKSVMFKDKDSNAVVTTSSDRVNVEVRETRRSRRGKLSEGSDVVECKGGKTAAKLDASKDNSIPHNMVNGEVRETRRGKSLEGNEVESGGKKATENDCVQDNGTIDAMVNGEVKEVRRSRRGKSLEGTEVESGGKKATGIDCLQENSTTDDMVNGEVKEVRRSRRVTFSEGSEVESKAGKGVTKGVALKDNDIVDDALDGDLRQVRRSRRGKITAGSDVLRGKLSAAGDLPSDNLQNEEKTAVKKQLSSKRGVRDEERRETEGVGKGSKKGSNVRNLRSRKEKDCEDVAGNKEAVTESVSVQLEAEVTRSKRHVVKVEKVRPMSKNVTKNETIQRGRPRSKIAVEVEENSGVDDKSKTVNVQDSSLVEGRLRRSQRNASKLECSISMKSTDAVSNANNRKETKKSRDAGLEGETATSGKGNSNERPSRKITRNTKRSGRVALNAEMEKTAEKEKGRLARSNIEVEVSSNVDIPADADAEAASTEAPIDAVLANCINAELSASVPEFENTIPADSNFSTEGQGEAFTHDERNEGNDSKTATDILTAEKDCMDGNLEIFYDELDKQHGAVVESTSFEAHSTSLCTVLVEKGMLENLKEREQPCLVELNSSEPENSLTLIDACEVTNFEHHEMSSFEDSYPDENGNLKTAHKNSEDLWELKSPDAIGRSQLDGGVNCDDDIIYPSDVQEQVLVFTEPSAKAVETETKFSGTFHDSKSVESPKTSLSVGMDGEAFKAVYLETHLEMSAQSRSDQNSGVESLETELDQDGHEEFEQLKPLEDGPNCSLESQELNSSVRTKFGAVQDKIGPGNGDSVTKPDLDHSLQYNESNDGGKTSFSLIQHQDLPDDVDPIAACDVEKVVLCGEGTQIVVGSEGTELEQSSSKSCSRSNSPQKSSPLLTHQRSGVCSEVETKEESVSLGLEAFFMTETPSTGDNADIEKCTMSMDTCLNPVGDTLDNDQPELMMEGMDKENYDCEGAKYVEMNEVGQEPMNLAMRNSDEVRSPHHHTAFIEDPRESPGAAYGGKLSPSVDTNYEKEEALVDTVDCKKYSELRMQSSKQRNGVHRDFLTEANKDLEEGLIHRKFSDFEESAHLMEAFDDHSLHDKMDSSVTHKLSLIQDQVISGSDAVEIAESSEGISSPPDVPTMQIIEGRCTELDFSARKSSSISSIPPNSDSIFKNQSVGMKFKSKHCFLTDDKEQNQGYEACFEGGNKEETDSVPALSIIQPPPSNNDDGLERSDVLLDGRSNEMSEGMKPKKECFSDCKSAKERETQENDQVEEGGPIEMVTSNTIGSEAANSAIEFDGCPLYAAYIALQNSNDNEQVQTSELLPFTEPASIPNSKLEENASNHENAMESVMMSISMGREEGLCQLDDKSTKEEQEKEVSGHEDCVDVDNDYKQGMTLENIFTDAFDNISEDELRMLFGTSNTSYENATNHYPASDSLHDSISHVASAEDTDGLILEESDGTLPQPDEQKIDVGEETLKDDEHAESGVEVHTLSFDAENLNSTPHGHLLMKAAEFIPLVQPEAVSVEEPVIPASENDAPDIELDQGKVGDLVETETKSISGTTADQCAENADECQQKAVSVEEPVIPAGENNAPEELDQGKVADFVEMETKSISVTAADQCAKNADECQQKAVSAEEPVIPAGEHNPPDEIDQDKVADFVDTETKSISVLAADQCTANADEGKQKAVSVEDPVIPAGANNAPDKELDQGKVADLVETETKSKSGMAADQCAANADEGKQKAVTVEEPVTPAGENNVPGIELDQGKVADLVETETKPISGTAALQCAANADEFAALERDLVSKLKTDSARSKNLGAAAGESIINSAAKYTPKRKNARTILIHGTPNKLQMASHMKENAPISKLEKVGSLTSVRPTAKRSALKRIPWK